MLGTFTTTITVLPQPPAPPTPPNPNPCTPNQPILIDPVAGNLVSAGAIANSSQLATATNAVQGAAADGVTQLLLRIPATNPGDNLTVQVLNESNELDSTANDGGLFAIGGSSASPANSLTVEASTTSQGPMAFAAYISPTNFYRGSQDGSNIQRTITFQVSCSNGSGQAASTISFLVRPPVVLIHGLWSSAAEAWSGFIPQNTQNATLWGEMQPYPGNAVDYSNSVNVTATSPSFPTSLSQVSANALGFAYNAPYSLLQMQATIHNYGIYWNAATVQADVVAHSMGGDIARTMPTLTNFLSGSGNYNIGFIHKLITIGTPHLGTQLAVDLLPFGSSDPNKCVRNALWLFKDVSLQTATVNGIPMDGAVGDLQLGVSGSQGFPTAYIAGSTMPVNLAQLDSSFSASSTLYNTCGTVSDDPLALRLTPALWNQEFGGLSNDGIVTVASQHNATSSTLTFSGIIHSPGIESLNFNPPTELDPASGIPDEVINLLNEQIKGSDFFPQSGGGGGSGS